MAKMLRKTDAVSSYVWSACLHASYRRNANDPRERERDVIWHTLTINAMLYILYFVFLSKYMYIYTAIYSCIQKTCIIMIILVFISCFLVVSLLFCCCVFGTNLRARAPRIKKKAS